MRARFPPRSERLPATTIASVIAPQEDLTRTLVSTVRLERNDMVQHFAENFDGFATTRHGWVQS